MKALLVEDDIQLRDYLGIVLETGLEVDVDEANYPAEALMLLEMDPDYNLIICGYEFYDKASCGVWNFLKKNQLHIPLILLSKTGHPKGFEDLPPIGDYSAVVKKPFKDPDILPMIELIIEKGEGLNYKVPQLIEAAPSLSEDFKDEWAELLAKSSSLAEEVNAEKKRIQEAEEADWSLKQSREEKERIKEKYNFEGTSEEEAQLPYKRVKIKRVITFTKLPSDIFIRLGKEKFTQIAAADVEFDPMIFQKYETQGIEYLYIPRPSYERFMSYVSNKVMSMLEVAANADAETHAAGTMAAMETVKDQVRDIGISPEVALASKACVDHALQSIAKMKDLDEILQKMMKGRNFISEHSFLITCFTTDILKRMDQGNEDKLNKLAMAAMFHDAMLEDEKLCRMRTITEAQDKGFSKKDMETLKSHPVVMANTVAKGEFIFADVDKIISQHHERPDGTGFPQKLFGTQIAPLACVFILAEEFTHKAFGKKLTREEGLSIIEKMSETFDTGNFKRPFRALKEAVETLNYGP